MAYIKHHTPTYNSWKNYPDESTPVMAETLSGYDNIIADIENQLTLYKNVAETGNYNDLDNRPKINGVTLTGNKAWEDLGLNLTLYASKQWVLDRNYLQSVSWNIISAKPFESLDENTFSVSDGILKLKQFNIYNSLNVIGASTSNTLEEVMAKVPAFSEVYINILKSTTSTFQKSLPINDDCEIRLHKVGSATKGYVEVIYQKTGDMYINTYYNSTFVGWKKLTQ